MIGYSRNELMGRSYRQFTNEENSKVLFQVFNAVYKNGVPIRGFEWQVRKKDGTKGFGEASISLLKGPGGKPVGFRGIVRDITQRRLEEEEKLKFQARLT
jgi:PAS domain S-box-containing protein